MTPRIPPKNQGQFSPGNVIRLEFPAQGYINPGKTTLEFDVQLRYTPIAAEKSAIRFQNNIQSIFSRVRLLYGSTPLEDIPSYNQLVRSLTEWTSSDSLGPDQTSITDGIGGITVTSSGAALEAVNILSGVDVPIIGNVRQKSIHGIDTRTGTVIDTVTPTGFGVVPNGEDTISVNNTSIKATNPTRRYQVQLALGMFAQEKLIPTKFMASQLAIEITLAAPEECIYAQIDPNSASTTLPTYLVTNVNLIPEILEFDASYDESFLRGLQTTGVPIKFSTWNNYRFSSNASSSSANLQIQERSRSVKAIFCIQKRERALLSADYGATFFNTNISTADGRSTLQDFQFRIGGR
jgi:hypothetical protein